MVSVPQLNENIDLVIFPNPANDFISLNPSFVNSDFVIYNLLGEKVKLGTLREETINISDLIRGTYIFVLIHQNEIISNKFVVIK